jgi:hypothetical protein
VILGDNGVGKTTLLQSLAEFQSVGEVFHDEAEGENLLRHAWFPRAYNTGYFLEARRYGTRESSRSLAGVQISLGGTLQHVSTQRTVEALSFVIGPDPHGNINTTGSFQNLDRLICYGYGATRRMGAVALSEQEPDDSTVSLFSDDVSLLNAEEWLLQSDYNALVDSPVREQARARRDQLIEVLINLLPEVSDIRFVRPTEIGRRPRVEVEVPYGWVNISDLSLGYRALVAWIVDFAYRMFERYQGSENPLAEPAIVLVDEIDLHLHPKWQRSLISYLTERFPNTQFIVTAHSPLIVQAATDANIVLLRREGDHVVIDNDVEAIRGWRIDQVLTSDLFGLETARPPEYDELLAQRAKLLGKAKLTKRDESRLKKLESEIGDLPAGESVADIEAMDVIRQAAEVLKREGTTGR